jgi:hypothetical protein
MFYEFRRFVIPDRNERVCLRIYEFDVSSECLLEGADFG